MRPWQQALIDNPPQLDYYETFDLSEDPRVDLGPGQFAGAQPVSPRLPVPPFDGGPYQPGPGRAIPPRWNGPRQPNPSPYPVPPFHGGPYVPPPGGSFGPPFQPRPGVPGSRPALPNPRGPVAMNPYQRLVGQKVLERLLGMRLSPEYQQANATRNGAQGYLGRM